MNVAQARRLLSVTEEDDLHSMKKKYRQLMNTCHPDALGSEEPEHIRRAQEINEAYQLLKNHPHAFDSMWKPQGKTCPKRKRPTWAGVVNEQAFCERNVYLYYTMETEEGHPYYRAARGKYLWEPKEEDFQLFLISIHEVVKELMEHTDKTMAVRSRLFQYLAEQFIEPVKVLRKIAKPVRLDQEGREIYRFRAYLKEDRQHPLREKTLLYPKAFQGSRILVQDKNGMEYGHLSFEDDRIYFCIIPLLKEKLARVKMEVLDGKVIFYFRLEKEAEQYRIPDRNLEIAKLLTKDEGCEAGSEV